MKGDIDIEKIPFITMDNIGEYFGAEDKEYTIEELIAKAEKEFDLAKKNSVQQKQIMLLNNACMWFEKIKEQSGNIPPQLFMSVKYSLLNVYISTDKADLLYKEIDDFYEKLSDGDKKIVELLYCNISYQYAWFLNKSGNIEEMSAIIGKILKILQNNDCDKALKIKSDCYSLLGSLFFDAKVYDKAIDFSLCALHFVEEIKEKTIDILDTEALYIFNLGNIYLQSDQYEYAIGSFKLAISFSRSHDNSNKFMIMQYAHNYLAQTYVCINEYEKAIVEYEAFIKYSNDNFDGDEAISVNGSFLYRIALIYHKFIGNKEKTEEYLSLATNEIEKYSNKNAEEYLDLKEQIDELRSQF